MHRRHRKRQRKSFAKGQYCVHNHNIVFHARKAISPPSLQRHPIFWWSAVVIIFIIMAAILCPLFYPRSYESTNMLAPNIKPNNEYWFGTDSLGRDIFARVWQGARISIVVGIVGAIIPQVLGCLIGCVSGYYGGKLDSIIMSIVDIGVCVPTLVYITLITLLLGNGLGTLILAISLSSWMDAARNCRSRMLQYKTREFILVAQSQGLPAIHIIIKHIFPNIAGQLIVCIFTAIPGAIFSEAYLSFIGLGITSPSTSLGQLCKSGISLYRIYPYQLWIPSAVLIILVLAFYLFGNSLRDMLDPRGENHE